MPRFMTWNCRGIADVEKFNQICAYRAEKGINTVFLQEGGNNYDGLITQAGNVRVSSFDEKHGGLFSATSNTFEFSGDTRTEQALQASFDNHNFTGFGADGSNKQYTIIDDAANLQLIPLTPPYAADNNLHDFIVKPADDWLQQMPEPPEPVADVTTKKRKRANSLAVTRKRRGVGFGLLAAGRISTYVAKTELHGPAEKRIHQLARRRPRKVVIPINGVNFNVYFWHASLGSDTTLETLELTPEYTPCKGHASGGDLALIVNIMFAKYLGITAAFPANTLLIGDLNIDNTAVQEIYHTDNVLSSLDGWCHVIAPAGVNLQQQFSGEFIKAGDNYNCNVGGFNLMVSDHAPVVFDI